ncbi:hypothetical protein [Streptomyces sp. V1I6]|uniref:hypothetical protein n=1 Tax=Streptomyces sp. V1I6 TaxID=3042273 RepID=UPI002789BA1A|nr:hypothetical protein [Streptomyces sp. V1I6]MDQ0842404.1 hypothetical protein [Streptomyces sp. V1I6]
MAIKRAKASFVAYIGGAPRLVNAGDLIDDSDPVVAGREDLFGSIEDHMARPGRTVEQATSEPGERRSVGRPAKRVAPSKPPSKPEAKDDGGAAA